MKKRFFLSIAFMITGVIIYCLFDIKLMTKSNVIFSFIRNYIPDICWTFSFFFSSIIFARNLTKRALILNSAYILGITVIFELLQYFKIVNGTFDICDILFGCISIIIACLFEKYYFGGVE